MKLLVTGRAGFIGSAVIRHMITNTYDEVVNLDKLIYAGNLEGLTKVNWGDRYSLEQAGICNCAEIDRVLT
jgi:dTDP-glucose 4,6-dehydratase